MDDLALGAKIERYTVEERLGAGGMAAVYRVRHDTLGTQHALKVLTVGGSKIRQRLVHEGRVQAMLDHPNVVAVRDVLDVNGSPGLLMDFVDGPDLEQWIHAQRPPAALAEDVFRQVVQAVRAAHRQGVIHRDLKPANVLMRKRSDGTWQPKVADFGLAKAVEDGNESLGKTRSGASLGTPAFMAPEQIRDASTVDHRADIWALGCIFYQLLTGEQAFDGDDIVEVFKAVTEGRYTPLRDVRPGVKDTYDQVISECLMVDREERLRSCDAVLNRLDGEDDPPSVQQTWEGGIVEPQRPVDSPTPEAARPSNPPSRPISNPPPRASFSPEGRAQAVAPGRNASLPPGRVPSLPPGPASGGAASRPPRLDAEPPGGPLVPPSTGTPSPAREAPPSAAPAAPPPVVARSITPLAWAIPLVMAFVIGGGTIAAVFGLMFVANRWSASSAASACEGFVRTGPVFFKAKGQTWVLPTEKDVVEVLPSAENAWTAGEPLCTLPAGTQIKLVEDPIKTGGTWVRATADNTKLPEPASVPEPAEAP